MVTMSRIQDRWISVCSCPARRLCKHSYALALHCLQNGVTEAGLLDPPEAPEEPRDELREPRVKGNNKEFYDAMRRAVKPGDRSLVDQLYVAFEAYSRKGQDQFFNLSFRISAPPFHFNVPPSSVPPGVDGFGDFCGYVAMRFMEKKLPQMNFIDSFIGSEGLRTTVAKWRRDIDIALWKERLKASGAEETFNSETELRMLVTWKSARLEWRAPAAERFKGVKQADWRRLQHGVRDGSLPLTGPASYLWVVFEKMSPSWFEAQLGPEHEEERRLLHQLFRDEGMRPRLANGAGDSFRWEEHPLVWRSEWRGDPARYEVELVTQSGRPVKGNVLVLPGSPYFYVTGDAVYRGPAPFIPGGSDLSHVVPVEALETQDGVEALQRAGSRLPETIEKRVRRLPMKVSLHCQLKADTSGKRENFELRVRAASPNDELVEEYHGQGWVKRERNIEMGDEFLLVERESLAAVPKLLAALRLAPDAARRKWVRRVNRSFAEEFVAWAESAPRDMEILAKGELATLLQPAVNASVEFEVEPGTIDWFDLRVKLDAPDLDFTPEELDLLLKARGGFVRIDGKGWRRLHFDLDEAKAERLSRLGLDPLDFSGEPQRLHVLQLADAAGEKEFAADTWREICRRAREIKARVTPAPPASVVAELRPYQLEGFHFLAYLAANHFGGILADDMGLGKTLQALTWLQWLREGAAENPQGAEHKPSLVVCPKSVMDVWLKEAEKFTPTLRLHRLGKPETAPSTELLSQLDLLVVNYAQLRLVSTVLKGIPWRAVILDEGQNIKNPDSQTARTARELKADHRLVLTGTPIENRLMDLWSLMAFAMPGILGGKNYFSRRFSKTEDGFTRMRLSARMRPFLLRRTKEQVAPELPSRTEEDVGCEMEGLQLKLYGAELKRARALLLRVKTDSALHKERFNILQSLIRLRQICCHPALIDADHRKEESAKMSALFDLLETMRAEGSKALVFSQFVTMLDILREEFIQRGWEYSYLTGQTEKRGELVSQFQEASGPKIFLLSLKAAGAGLNLTSAPYVILYDPWWNPAVEAQAIDRTHRIGQTQNVFAYRLVVRESIEEKIRLLQEKKKLLVDAVLGHEGFAKALTLDDLNFLLAE